MLAPEPVGFGQLLRMHRLTIGLTQEVLAERAGLSVRGIQALERGERGPQQDTLARLVPALGLSAEHASELTVAGRSRPRRSRSAELRAEQGGRVRLVPTRLSTLDTQPEVRSRAAGRLPRSLTPLVGRQQELVDIARRLGSEGVRLLTLVGPGGVGKTRLALGVAEALGARFLDGVVWVDLSTLREPDLVLPTLARTVGLHQGGTLPLTDMLVVHLQERQLLLVLDTFDHVVAAASSLAAVVADCPGLVVLATSRVVLRVSGEQVYSVRPLPVPAEAPSTADEVGQSPSVQLFLERARATGADVELTAETAPTLAKLCRRLDGMPLAIELAAARAALLQPEALLRRLEHRLPLLTGGAIDLPPRQQTLRDTLAWSHDLLGSAEKVLFRRLSVFAGGWTLEAAEAVCVDAELPAERILDHLQVLVDNSLLRRDDGSHNEPRFAMLDTIREYALDQLNECAEGDVIGQQHAMMYLKVAEQAETMIRGPEQALWLRRLDQEHDNLRAALAWATGRAGDGLLAVRLTAALGWFWYVHAQHAEGLRWAEASLGVGAAAPPATRSRALTGAAWLALVLTDHVRGLAWAEAAALLAREHSDQQALSAALAPLAMHRLWQGNRHGARMALDEGLTLARAARDHWQVTLHLVLLTTLEAEPAIARRHCAEALSLALTIGDPWLLEYVLTWLGELDFLDRDFTRAEARLLEALQLARAQGYPTEIAYALSDLASVARERGDLSQAARLLAESLALRRRAANPYRLGLALIGAAALAQVRCESRRAAHLLGAANRLLPGGEPVAYHRVSHADWVHTLAVTRAALGPESFLTAWQAGLGLASDAAVTDATNLLAELVNAEPCIAANARASSPAAARAQGVAGRRRRTNWTSMDQHAERSHASLSFKAAWSGIDQAEDPTSFVRFLERVREDPADAAQDWRRLAHRLRLHRGQYVLDVGCGLGEAVRALAGWVGPAGRAVGVDNSTTMIAQARRRSHQTPQIVYGIADAHGLPFADGTFDAACSGATLEIVNDPRRVVAELVRVIKRGGHVAISGPDLGSVVIDASDRLLTRRILDFICDHETNGWIGRQLPGLCREAGLVETVVIPSTWVVTDYAVATDVWLGRHLARAQAVGAVSAVEATDWRADLERRATAGRFFLARTAFLVAACKP